MGFALPDESVRVNDPPDSRKLSRSHGSVGYDDQVGPPGMTPSRNRISVFVRRISTVENRPGAQNFPDGGLSHFRSAGVDLIGPARQHFGMRVTAPIATPETEAVVRDQISKVRNSSAMCRL